MADVIGQHEVSDNCGSTVAFDGTATTSVSLVPAVAGEAISQIYFNAIGRNLEVSFDNGTTFYAFDRKDRFTWDVKGEITQLQIRTSSGSSDWSAIINFED